MNGRITRTAAAVRHHLCRWSAKQIHLKTFQLHNWERCSARQLLHCSGRVKIFVKFEIKGTSDRNIFTLSRLEIKTTWNCVKLFFWRWCNFIILERGHEPSSSREKLIEVAMALMLSQISSLQSRYQHTVYTQTAKLSMEDPFLSFSFSLLILYYENFINLQSSKRLIIHHFLEKAYVWIFNMKENAWIISTHITQLECSGLNQNIDIKWQAFKNVTIVFYDWFSTYL